MPGGEEFVTRVGGEGDGPVATSQASAFETNNYEQGGSFTVGEGTNTYPFTVDPAALIQELMVTETGEDIRVDITTADGTVITDIHLRAASISEDFISIDSVTFKDPNGTGIATFGYWVGE